MITTRRRRCGRYYLSRKIGARRVRKLAQHHVASGMTQMIIDLMQANQIHVHHRQRLVMGGLDEFHIIVESVAVEQPRQ